MVGRGGDMEENREVATVLDQLFSAVNLCLLLCKASLVTVDVLGNVADELRTSEVPVQKDDTR